MTPEEENAKLRAKNARLAKDLKNALDDLALLDNCEVCLYGQTGRCTATNEQTIGGSCFVWRGRRAKDAN